MLAGFAFGQINQSMSESTATRWGGNNFLVGTVYFPNGQPINRRMFIRLSSAVKGEVTATTDDRGKFIFSGLDEGYYSVVIEGEKEFEPVSQTVEVLRRSNPVAQSYLVSIRLVEKRVPANKPTVVNVEDAGAPKTAVAHYDKALELGKTKDHAGAVAQLKMAVVIFPKYLNAYNELAVQYLRLGELQKADEAALAALKIKPDAFEPMLNRGIVLFRMNRFAEAEFALREVLKANDMSAIGHFYLGRTLAKTSKYDEAETELNRAITISPEGMKEAHRILAMLYIDKDDRPKAIVSLETYLRLVPEPPDVEQLKRALAQLKIAVGKP